MNLLRKLVVFPKILFNYKKKKLTLDQYPIRLWIESSLTCNIKCVMCPNKEIPSGDKGIMDFDLYKKIIDEAAEFVSDIYLHHRGEPFVNPKLYDMVRYAKDKGIKVRFHTNGTIITKENAEKILEAGPDLISISFDGFQKDIYEEIRVGADFDKTVANISNLLERKKQKNKKLPYIVIECIDFPKYNDRLDNEKIIALETLFKEKGVDEIIHKKEYEWVVESAPTVVDKTSYKQCTFPWYAMVICYDGTVTPCPQDYMAGIKMGNVAQQTIREIWNDKPYQMLRDKLLNDIDSLDLCKKCDRLCRKQIGGVPLQYLATFLTDHFLGYGKLRKMVGSFERN